MRAAVVTEIGSPPSVSEIPDPVPGPGETLVEVLAAPLNPIDISVGAGRFFGGHPPLPYVPGCEAIGRVLRSEAFAPRTLVWIFGGAFGTGRDGGIAERAVASDVGIVALPEDAEPEMAAALGIAGIAAWLPLSWRAPLRSDDRVLILGVTGTVGLVALQAARLLGARRVVGAGRNVQGLQRALDLGADAVVALDHRPRGALAVNMREALGGQGPTYVFDPLWGEPLLAAVEAAAPGARIVNLGQAADASAELTSAAVRGKQLEIYGHLNFAASPEIRRAAHRALLDHAAAGRLTVPIAGLGLDAIPAAWQRQAEGADVKLVIRMSVES